MIAANHPFTSKANMIAEIRKAISDDVPAIVELCQQHAVHEQALISKQWLNEPRLNELLFGKELKLQCLVVEAAGVVEGYATFCEQYSTWHGCRYMYLDCLFLAEKIRGKGLGRKLMQTLGKIAKESGCDHLQWQTPSFNHRALDFYRKLGANAKPKQRFQWSIQSTTTCQLEETFGIAGLADSPASRYANRSTRMSGVRSVNGWKLKIYEISLDGIAFSAEVIDAALKQVSQQTIWPGELKHQYGFVTLHRGEQAVWLLTQLWVEDILRQFVSFAPLDDPKQFGVSPMPGFNACVWELEVTKHERDTWVRHVMSTPEHPDYAAYLIDSLVIE